MTLRNPQTRRLTAIGMSALLTLAACDTTTSTPTTVDARQDAVNISPVSLAIADVIPGTTAGAFNTATANNSGRGSSEFWDNPSADDAATSACNIGFYASGTLATDCQNQAAGSNANQGGYTKFWGDGTLGNDASAFTFDGTRSYTVTLLGSYAGSKSTVGWFTKDGAGYVFHDVALWTDRTVNHQITIDASMTGGRKWGFFIRNDFNPTTGGCLGDDTDCSDAEGGFSAPQYNQFAMFSNDDQSKFLVGAEDNKLELLPENTEFRDSDYNDYIWSVVPAVVGGKGCSPGYWKTHDVWPAPYLPTTQFSAVFDNAFPGKTLQQVLALGGGGLNALGRQTVSALLNGAQLGSSFELSPATVISQFNAAYPGTNGAYTTLKDSYEALTDINGRICPLR